ncbi:unnamed protein product [Hydatigera taeniaeformis]|uniref:Protocadherin-1 n=1 Tax=Hydatigena taeniaeformis TaxID=6205 RepID=A0A0R3X3J4_HYDTA|nr:unnamed protein product [Hydatigera taeniaeformis]
MMSVWSSQSPFCLILIFFLASAKYEVTYVVKEEADNGTFIGNILVDSGLSDVISTGGDMGIQLYEDQVTGLFRTDGNSGRLVVSGRIDREMICPQRGTISASNLLLGGVDNTPSKCQVDFIAHIPPDHWINIAVIVEDINDHAPQFQHNDPNAFGGRTANPPYIVFISEGVSIGYEVPLTGATDEDADNNGIQSYTLCGTDIDNSTFDLKFALPGELNLVVKKKLDFEEKTSYKGQIKACDGGRPIPQCAYQNISIFITDSNDNKPHFDKEIYELRISEATPVMTVIAVVTAKDADSGDFGKLTYRFGQVYDHNAINFFGINENTGEVWVKRPLDAKIMSHLKIPVIAQDGGTIPKTGTAMLQIDIEDVNNHPPWIEVKPISPPAGMRKSTDGYVQLWVEENQPIGTQIGIILTGDQDIGPNGEVSCELKGNNSPFQLSYSSSGQERKMYGLQSTIRFDLEAMLPHAPIALQVECSDAGTPKIVSRQNIQVNIVDVNEFPAHFTKIQSNLVVHLPEDAPPGSLVVEIQATDRDATPKMKFELVESGSNLFRIDSSSGRIYTLGSFDREQTGKIDFAVRVVDMDVLGPRTPNSEYELANITVVLDDVNDNSPALESICTFKILENRPAYSDLIGQLRAFDPDLGENGTVRFMSSNELFDINPISGKIYAKAVLDREIVSQYQLEVEISDLGRPFSRKTLERISIIVEDVNDNEPVWKVPEKMHQEISITAVTKIIRSSTRYAGLDGVSCVALVNISHQAPTQLNIVKLMASDADTEPNANFSFSIVSGNYYSDTSFALNANYTLNLSAEPQYINANEHFHINQITWVVSVLNSELPSQDGSGLFELILRVSDNGNPPLHSDALMYIQHRKNNGFVAYLFGILHHSKHVILFVVACLMVCSVVLPVVICLIRNRRKSQECGGRGIVACVSGEGVGQNYPPNDRSAAGGWAKEQMLLAQPPFISSFDIAEEMSASLIRCSTDREAVNFSQMSNVQCQVCPSLAQLSGYSALTDLIAGETTTDQGALNSFGRKSVRTTTAYYLYVIVFYPTPNMVEPQVREENNCTHSATLLDGMETPSHQVLFPYSNFLNGSLVPKHPHFSHELHTRRTKTVDMYNQTLLFPNESRK